MAPDWRSLGARIELAREAAGLSQAELAEALGVDRTAISKIQSGTRKVSALELAAAARVLHRPLAWLLSDSPEPVVARRQELNAVADRPSALLAELAAEDLAADVEQLRGLGALSSAPDVALVGSFGRIDSDDDAAAAARAARGAAGLGDEPLGPLADVLDRFSLYVASTELAESIDGLLLPCDDFSVSIVNAAQDPGRRRFTAAHELGHHLFDDTYSAEVISSRASGRERLVNAFAAEFLLPLDVVRNRCAGDSDPAHLRENAIWLSSTYRVSWSGVLARLRDADLLVAEAAPALRPTPTLAELRSYGVQPTEDLVAGDLSVAVTRAVLEAHRSGLIGAGRASEMLRGTGDDLPPRPEPGLNDLRADFYA